jgi:hypothetical protein
MTSKEATLNLLKGKTCESCIRSFMSRCHNKGARTVNSRKNTCSNWNGTIEPFAVEIGDVETRKRYEQAKRDYEKSTQEQNL